MTLSQSLEKFISNLEKLQRSNSTITAYSKDIEQLNFYLENESNLEDINEVKAEHLNNYINKIKSDKKCSYTLKTVSRKINSMKTFYKFLHANQIISSNPANTVQHPKYKIAPPRLLSKMEYLALRDITRNNMRLYTVVELLLQTGVRIGELARLRLEDINLESNNKRYIHIRPFGSSKERKVPLTEQAISAIKKYLSIRPQPKNGVNTLFVTKNGNSLLVRNIRTSISRALEKIGIEDATVNDIRNTFIVHQLKQGMPTEVVGELVGHKRLTSTKRYLELIDKKPKRKSTKIVPL